MRTIAVFGLVTVVALTGCGEPDAPTAVLPLEIGSARAMVDGEGSTAHLTGASEVPERETRATGQAIFRRTADGLSYRLIVANIDNVVQSHIHLGPPDENGPVVAFLAGPFPAGGGSSNGVLATGVITDANLIGPLAGQTLDDLVAAIDAGRVYVNVHTNDGVSPPNTGPGDFPGGEVRGQIR
ncbi:MAG TPA: CHRD domain-containing protein [Longimicrobiales bacterium]|nr:CHRD domain-containing protein [Longimicrobiales bacterium]